jgi:hypothetical protein
MGQGWEENWMIFGLLFFAMAALVALSLWQAGRFFFAASRD